MSLFFASATSNNFITRFIRSEEALFVCRFLVVVALFTGCSVAPTLIIPACPPAAIIPCEPGSFNQVLLDTAFRGERLPYVHITHLPSPINSSTNDYTYRAFPSINAAITTSDRVGAMNLSSRGVQRIFWSPLTDPSNTSRQPMREVASDLAAAYGAGFLYEKTGEYFFSGKAANDDPNDFDLFVGKLARAGDGIALSDAAPVTALNLANYFDSQPTISSDGERIYFASDRPGGYGGTDIWIADRATVTSPWGAPRLLESGVNTPCDELSPFMRHDTLYFASSGHSTVGGYDLFWSKITTGKDAVHNIGKPINTSSDEIFPSWYGGKFYYSSNQLSATDFDLYTITSTRSTVTAAEEKPIVIDSPVRVKPTIIDSVRLLGEVTRGETGYAARDAEVFVQENNADEILRKKTDSTGRFDISLKTGAEYNVGAESNDAFFDMKHVDLRAPRDSVYRIALHLPDTLVLRINFPFDDYQHPYDFVIGDDGQPTGITWQNSLDRAAHSILQSMPKLKKLIITGHTDSLGSDDYNDRLGDRRARFVMAELIKRGLPASLIGVETAGRRHPPAIRAGEYDEAFRLRSRRVEFVKVFK